MNIRIDFAQVMLTKLCTDMLNNQINCNMVITSSWNNHISILLWRKNKIIECWFHKPPILHVPEEYHVTIHAFIHKSCIGYKIKHKVIKHNMWITWSSTELISLPLSTVSRLILRASLTSASDWSITQKETNEFQLIPEEPNKWYNKPKLQWQWGETCVHKNFHIHQIANSLVMKH